MSSAAEQIAAKARRLAPYFTSGIVALQGPQGSGKSALVQALVAQKRAAGVRCAAASLDDFYLPHEGLRAVAAANPGNALLQGRGLPGTHDVALLARVLGAVRAGRGVAVPRFDKGARGGAGDRGKPGRVPPALGLFVLEGWCVNTVPAAGGELRARRAAAPAGAAARAHPLAALEQINAGFAALHAVLGAHVDTRVSLVAPPAWVTEWRIQQEHALRAERGQGMSDDQVRAFVARYMPVYECWDSHADVTVRLDRARQIVDITGPEPKPEPEPELEP